MRGRLAAAGLMLAGGIGPTWAEPGSFFKNMFGGGGGGGSSASEAPALSAPRAQDPDVAYCPTIDVGEGGAALQAFAGAAGDSGHLRHLITFGRLSRECAVRPGGAVAVKVGVQVRALLGPAGSAGSFDAPLTVSVKYNGVVLDSRTRRVTIPVPAGAAQGEAAVIVSDLTVPADKAVGYDIEVSLAGGAKDARSAPKTARARPKQPKPALEATAGGAPATPHAAASAAAAAAASVGQAPASLFDQSPDDPE